jgi:hypothetical protein
MGENCLKREKPYAVGFFPFGIGFFFRKSRV